MPTIFPRAKSALPVHRARPLFLFLRQFSLWHTDRSLHCTRTHTLFIPNHHIAKPGTLSDSQFGFQRKFQTTDHSIALASKRTLHPSSYALYLGLAKAFNAVVLNTLFKLLARAGFPPEFIDMVKRLYRASLGTPRVNGYRTASRLQLRGLRQG